MPALPDGLNRVPVNQQWRIEEFEGQTAERRRYEAERTRWVQQMDSLRSEVQRLKAATIILAADAEGKANSPITRSAAQRLSAAEARMALLERDAPARLEEEPVRLRGSAVPVVTPSRLLPVQQLDAPAPASAPPTPPSSRSRPADQQGPSEQPHEGGAAPQEPIGPARPSQPRPQNTSFSSSTLASRPVAPSLLQAEASATSSRLNGPRDSRKLFRFPSGTLDVGSSETSDLVSAARNAERIVIQRQAGDSTKRAENVRAYLLGQGIPPDRVWIGVTPAREELSVLTVENSSNGVISNRNGSASPPIITGAREAQER